MHVVPAMINKEGVETIYSLGEHPNMLDSYLGSLSVGFASFDQFYVPGISVPDVKHLNQPFYVPVIGDDEPVSLVIDYAHMDAPYHKRVTFIGKIIAESISLEPPMPDREPFIDEEDVNALQVDEAFDDLCGDGGFLRVTASSTFASTANVNERPLLHGFDILEAPELTISGDAELYLFDDIKEFETVEELLLTGRITAIDILAHMRETKVSKLLQR